jgi:hypothetical protein
MTTASPMAIQAISGQRSCGSTVIYDPKQYQPQYMTSTFPCIFSYRNIINQGTINLKLIYNVKTLFYWMGCSLAMAFIIL